MSYKLKPQRNKAEMKVPPPPGSVCYLIWFGAPNWNNGAMLRGVHVRGVRVRYCPKKTSLEETKSWRVGTASDRVQLD